MLSDTNVEKLAHLARIGISDAEAARISADVDAILAYVAHVQEAPAADAEHRVGSHYNVLREDGNAHTRGAYTDALLRAAPHTDAAGTRIQVKKILSHE